MPLITYSISNLRSLPRPAGYVDEILAAAVSCTATTVTVDDASPKYLALREKYGATAPPQKSKGLGDTVARVIQTATLGKVVPCQSCKERQAALNKLVPYKQD